jgi:DNA-binding MarR family transcriptional regulator
VSTTLIGVKMALAMRGDDRLSVVRHQHLSGLPGMSRGHGRAQRLILERLTDRWNFASARTIAESFPSKGIPVAPAMIETVRRALRALEREGLVCIYQPGASGTTKLWSLTATQRKRAERERSQRKARERKSKRDDEILKAMPVRKPQPQRDMLVKILGMLGSDQDGEALSAARKAETLRVKLGLSWDAIVRMFLPLSPDVGQSIT